MLHPVGARADRVPVEHRLFGLDRRTLPFAAVAAGVWLLWTVLLPWVADQVHWSDPIRAGDRVQVTDGVSFSPPVGWDLTSGLRTTARTRSGVKATPATVLTNGGVQVVFTHGQWTGTTRALLDQITKITTTTSGGKSITFSTAPTSIQTSSGESGIVEAYRSPRVEGLIGAFVLGDEGVKIQVVGPPDQLTVNAQDIGRMLASIRYDRPSR